MSKATQRFTLVCLLCIGLQSAAQEPSSATDAGRAPTSFVFTWRLDTPGCDRFYANGEEIESISTSQALIMVSPSTVIGKLGLYILVKNPIESTERIDVIPDNVHLFKTSGTGLSEVKSTAAAKIAHSMEKRQRIAQSLAAGLSGAGSQTTASGTATYSDGTTASYTVTAPNSQAQANAINNAREAIDSARERGSYIVASELKRNTLSPGQETMGQLFFPKQKTDEDLLARIEIANVIYEFPFRLSKTGRAESRNLEAKINANSEPDTREPQGQRAEGLSVHPDSTAPAANIGKIQGVSRQDANQGNAKADFKIGLQYARGQGVQQDFAEAAIWYTKAANQGLPAAQVNLGYLYYHGRGLPQDYSQAALWFRKAADQSDPRAQSMLAELYYYGRGVPKDYTEAVTWTRKAADAGYALAENNLGDFYENGLGVSRDYLQAAVWYRKAAEQANAIAQFNLGSLYQNGHGVQQDYSEAYFWLDLAAALSKGKNQEQFAKTRDEVAAKLTSTELSDAQDRAAKWSAAHQPEQ